MFSHWIIDWISHGSICRNKLAYNRITNSTTNIKLIGVNCKIGFHNYYPTWYAVVLNLKVSNFTLFSNYSNSTCWVTTIFNYQNIVMLNQVKSVWNLPRASQENTFIVSLLCCQCQSFRNQFLKRMVIFNEVSQVSGWKTKSKL